MKHIYKHNGKYYLLESEFLKLFKIPGKFNKKLDQTKNLEATAEAISVHISNESFSVRQPDTNLCNRLVLNMTNQCNLACKYCYAEGGDYGQENSCLKMTVEVMKKTVDRIYSMYSKGIHQIQFFGGEPLLNKPVLVAAIDYIKEQATKRGIDRPIFTMVTNGILIDDEMIDLFNREFESITISLDGSKSVNDKMRVMRGSFDSVFDKVARVIEKIHNSEKNYYLCMEGTIHDEHIKEFSECGELLSYEAMKSLKPDIIHISPIIANRKLNSQYVDFFKKWSSLEINSGISNIKTRSIASLLYCAKEKEKLGNGCGAVYTDIAIDVDGSIYPCFMFIGNEEFKIGNINDSIEKISERNRIIRQYLVQANNNETCNQCWVKPICGKSYGHCIGARYLVNCNISKPVEDFCNISKGVLETSFAETYERYGKGSL